MKPARFILILEDDADPIGWRTAELRLQRAVKDLLRNHGLRVLSVAPTDRNRRTVQRAARGNRLAERDWRSNLYCGATVGVLPRDAEQATIDAIGAALKPDAAGSLARPDGAPDDPCASPPDDGPEGARQTSQPADHAAQGQSFDREG